MNSSTDKNAKILCIGAQSRFDQLRSSLSYNTENYVYAGTSFDGLNCKDSGTLLLDTELSLISFCIINGLKDVSFYHDGIILSDKDTDKINELNTVYLKNRDYSHLKQFNIIRMFFDICNQRTTMSSFPAHIQYETTTFCNARCIMCDHFIAHNRGSKHLELSSVESLSPILPYVSMMILHGNGEPLINPQIVNILDLYSKYKIAVSLNTNLSYLTDDILSALHNCCSSIHVSCDGINEKQYESIRQGLSFSKFTANIDRLQSRCGNVDRIMEVVLMKQNIMNAKDFVRFASDHGFSKVILNALGCNEWIGNTDDGLDDCLPYAYSCCMEALDTGARLGVSVVTPFDGRGKPDGDSKTIITDSVQYPDPCRSQMLHEKYPWYTNTIAVNDLEFEMTGANTSSPSISGVCEYPFAKAYIDLSGNVSVCCPKSRLIVDTISPERTFDVIWNCDMYKTMRKNFYNGKLPLMCEDCFLINNGSLSFLKVKCN